MSATLLTTFISYCQMTSFDLSFLLHRIDEVQNELGRMWKLLTNPRKSGNHLNEFFPQFLLPIFLILSLYTSLDGWIILLIQISKLKMSAENIHLMVVAIAWLFQCSLVNTFYTHHSTSKSLLVIIGMEWRYRLVSNGMWGNRYVSLTYL